MHQISVVVVASQKEEAVSGDLHLFYNAKQVYFLLMEGKQQWAVCIYFKNK